MENIIKGKIKMASGDVIGFELYPSIAPITVNNFTKLVKSKFYDGLTFHRCIPGFVIQGGCPEGNGMCGPGWNIKGEFSRNGVENPIKHELGVLSMARGYHPDSAGSQFFIMVGTAPHLDGQYAAFGKVTSNIQACLDIADVKTNVRDMPIVPIIIESITIDEE